MAILNQLLQPFIRLGVESERQQETNLRAILFEGAKFGLMLFSQSTSWHFDWKARRRAAKSHSNRNRSARDDSRSIVVIFPALVKIANSDGSRYAGRKVLVEAEIIEWQSTPSLDLHVELKE
jgi:hypothetical protein